VIQSSARLVDATVEGELVVAAIRLLEWDAFLKGFGSSNQYAFSIANGKRPQLNGKAMPGFVAERDLRLDGFSVPGDLTDRR
jgi:hypothetical protein